MPTITNLLIRIDDLSDAALDALPWGTIQLGLDGTVLRYNATEGRLAHRDPGAQIGRNFFTEIAPCTQVREFHGRFADGVTAGQLSATFEFVFKFDHGWRQVNITMMYSERTRSIWVVVHDAA